MVYEVNVGGDPDTVGVFVFWVIVYNKVCICDRAVGMYLSDLVVI